MSYQHIAEAAQLKTGHTKKSPVQEGSKVRRTGEREEL